MKLIFLKIVLTIIINIASVTSFSQENKQMAKARKNLIEAKNDLIKAKTDSIEDFRKFKKESELTITKKKNKSVNDAKTSKWLSFKLAFENDLNKLGNSVMNVGGYNAN